MLHYNAGRGLYPDSIEAVREQIRAAWKAAFIHRGLPELEVGPETPAGQLIDSQTAAIVQKDNELLYLAQQFNPATSEGIWQAALGQIYFLQPKGPQKSYAMCVCAGARGTVIPQGAAIKSCSVASEQPGGGSVGGLVWTATEGGVIGPTGNVSLRFECSEAGPEEAAEGSLNQIVTVVPGWDTVTNPSVAVVGADAEGQAAFERRRYQSVAKNARGSVAALFGAISDLPNVLECRILENTTNHDSEPSATYGAKVPAHGVWIAVIGGSNADIAEQIWRKKDAGCATANADELAPNAVLPEGREIVTYIDRSVPSRPVYDYYIGRPVATDFGVQVTVGHDADTEEQIASAIRQAVQRNFRGQEPGLARVGMAQTVFASRFYGSVLSAGVSALVNLKVRIAGGAWQDSVDVSILQNPVLADGDISVVTAEEP